MPLLADSGSVKTTSEQLDSSRQAAPATTTDPDGPAVTIPRAVSRRTTLLTRLALATGPFKQTILIYFATRVLLLVVAILDDTLRHHSLTSELANWDGLWYRQLANHGYPGHVSHAQTTLGFFPLYPIVIYAFAQPLQLLTAHSAIWSITIAGVIVSTIGGLIAAVLMQELATGWWGERAGRRAAALFCLFPGSVVFSMVYAEGILIPLAAGCILALERRRSAPGRAPGRARHRLRTGGAHSIRSSSVQYQPVASFIVAAGATGTLGAACSRRFCRSRESQPSPSTCGATPARRSPPCMPSTTAGRRRPTRWRSCTWPAASPTRSPSRTSTTRRSTSICWSGCSAPPF